MTRLRFGNVFDVISDATCVPVRPRNFLWMIAGSSSDSSYTLIGLN